MKALLIGGGSALVFIVVLAGLGYWLTEIGVLH